VHPVLPENPISENQCSNEASYFRCTYVNDQLTIVEKILDAQFEYSFQYEYWPSGNLKRVITTRPGIGITEEYFADKQ